MGTQTACEQAIAVAHVADVVLAAVGILDAAGEAVAPNVDVMLGVAAHGGDAGGAGGHVNLAHVLHGHGEHAVGVVVAQVLLGGEGGLLQVGQRLHRVGVEACLVKEVLVERNVLVDVDDGLLQALELNLLNLLVGHMQNLVLLTHVVSLSHYSSAALR